LFDYSGFLVVGGRLFGTETIVAGHGGGRAMKHPTLSADLIADIYEAAVDDERWPGIAGIVATATGMPSAGVWFIDDGEVRDISLTEDIRATQQPYLAHYAKLDMWQQGLFRGPWERPRVGYELFSERDLIKTEFYNDFARRAGMFRPMGAVIRLARNSFATVATNRLGSSRLVEEEDKPNLARVLPHMRRALQLRLTQRRSSPRGQIHAAALDTLAFGVVVCEARGRIVLINKAAEALARDRAGITLGKSGRGLGALVAAESAALAAMINDAAGSGPGGVIRLTGRGESSELIALITPLPRSFGLGTGPAYALVTLRSARDSPSFSAETLIALFHVSPAQAEIALAIYNGKTPEQIAGERGVTISTLRTHLAEIFLRTGTESQRDLVRLLGMLPPVRQQFLER
jgi:DNA-binding CsgD family transcriptional regulator/PAS domain-containing protein